MAMFAMKFMNRKPVESNSAEPVKDNEKAQGNRTTTQRSRNSASSTKPEQTTPKSSSQETYETLSIAEKQAKVAMALRRKSSSPQETSEELSIAEKQAKVATALRRKSNVAVKKQGTAKSIASKASKIKKTRVGLGGESDDDSTCRTVSEMTLPLSEQGMDVPTSTKKTSTVQTTKKTIKKSLDGPSTHSTKTTGSAATRGSLKTTSKKKKKNPITNPSSGVSTKRDSSGSIESTGSIMSAASSKKASPKTTLQKKKKNSVIKPTIGSSTTDSKKTTTTKKKFDEASSMSTKVSKKTTLKKKKNANISEPVKAAPKKMQPTDAKQKCVAEVTKSVPSSSSLEDDVSHTSETDLPTEDDASLGDLSCQDEELEPPPATTVPEGKGEAKSEESSESDFDDVDSFAGEEEEDFDDFDSCDKSHGGDDKVADKPDGTETCTTMVVYEGPESTEENPPKKKKKGGVKKKKELNKTGNKKKKKNPSSSGQSMASKYAAALDGSRHQRIKNDPNSLAETSSRSYEALRAQPVTMAPARPPQRTQSDNAGRRARPALVRMAPMKPMKPTQGKIMRRSGSREGTMSLSGSSTPPAPNTGLNWAQSSDMVAPIPTTRPIPRTQSASATLPSASSMMYNVMGLGAPPPRNQPQQNATFAPLGKRGLMRRSGVESNNVTANMQTAAPRRVANGAASRWKQEAGMAHLPPQGGYGVPQPQVGGYVVHQQLMGPPQQFYQPNRPMPPQGGFRGPQRVPPARVFQPGRPQQIGAPMNTDPRFVAMAPNGNFTSMPQGYPAQSGQNGTMIVYVPVDMKDGMEPLSNQTWHGKRSQGALSNRSSHGDPLSSRSTHGAHKPLSSNSTHSRRKPCPPGVQVSAERMYEQNASTDKKRVVSKKTKSNATAKAA